MKSIISCFFPFATIYWLSSCSSSDRVTIQNNKEQINTLLDSFNLAVPNTYYDRYFSSFANNAVFMGTDAIERWTKQQFMEWALHFFERGKA